MVLMASMGWSVVFTQAAATALAKPFFNPSNQADDFLSLLFLATTAGVVVVVVLGNRRLRVVVMGAAAARLNEICGVIVVKQITTSEVISDGSSILFMFEYR
jgi:hypothetical protein